MGGAERVTVRLANYAAKCGIDTHIITLVGAGPLEAALDSGVHFHSLEAKRIRGALLPFYRKLFRLRPDTLMATLPQVNAMTVAVSHFLPKKPRLVLREANDTRFESPYAARTARWMALLMRMAYRQADKVIAVSEGVREGLMERYALSPERVVALPNASIDDGIFAQAEAELDNEWYLQLDRRIICVARFVAQKDHYTLLEAFANLPTARRTGLLLIGGGALEHEIRAKIASLNLNDRVRIVTGESNPYKWMKWADVMVLSSRWEGSPNVLIEALALGIPVVSTDCPSGPQELLAGGRYGELVPVGDARALALALARAIDMEADPDLLKERGMEFHVERVGPEWLAELESA